MNPELIQTAVVTIIFVILGFLLTFFLFRRRNKQMIKNWRFWLVGCIFSVLLYLIIPVGLITYMELKPYVLARPFDSDEWKAAPRQRVQLIDSLIRSKQLDGKTKKEVTALLGEDEEEYGSKDMLVYYLGFQRGFTLGMDSEWLYIYFQEGVVSGYKIIYG